MPKLTVARLSRREWGTSRVRLNKAHRNGVPRYGIAQITNNTTKKSAFAILLGHDDPSAIFMDYDMREELGVQKGDTLDFTVTSACLPKKVWWYLSINDPMVRIPAWLAFWSVILGVVGIGIGLYSVFGVEGSTATLP